MCSQSQIEAHAKQNKQSWRVTFAVLGFCLLGWTGMAAGVNNYQLASSSYQFYQLPVTSSCYDVAVAGRLAQLERDSF